MNGLDPRTELALIEASDCVGIYPAAVMGRKRTEWQDGWNAASLALMHQKHAAIDWFRALPPDVQPVVSELLIADAIGLHFEKEKVRTAYVLLNDVFDYACADCEDVSLEEMPLLAEVYRAHQFDGIVAWASNKRDGIGPIKQLDTNGYREAKAFLAGKVAHAQT